MQSLGQVISFDTRSTVCRLQLHAVPERIKFHIATSNNVSVSLLLLRICIGLYYCQFWEKFEGIGRT